MLALIIALQHLLVFPLRLFTQPCLLLLCPCPVRVAVVWARRWSRVMHGMVHSWWQCSQHRGEMTHCRS